MYTVGIVTVSDTAARDAASDKSGPALAAILGSTAGFVVHAQRICADDGDAIRDTVSALIDVDAVHLVVTTGGTGFGRRDVTPEALGPLITRPTPALTHALTAHSLRQTPLAALSRAVTGIRRAQGRDALIVALPGSPKAVRECLDLLLADGLLSHALELLTGGTGQATHQHMQGALHRHHHHHHHGLHAHSAPTPHTTAADHAPFRTHDPSAGPSLRLRQSPYPIIALDEALALIAQHTPAPTRTVTLPLSPALVGHVLAESVSADTDLPPGPTTNVDGYAVASASTPPGEYDVVTLSTLQQRSAQTLGGGEIFRINTGQGLPAGTDAVVMVEDTALRAADGGEETRVRVLAQVAAGENVRARASDVHAGQTVLARGTVLSSLGGEIGTLAFLGRAHATVHRKPVVGILSTGNELVDAGANAGAEPWGFAVYDANRPSLRAAVEALGYATVDLGIVRDDAALTLAALERGVRETDVVITTGGTSMGESDLLKPLLERALHGRIHFGRVAMKPGKPTTFATVDSTLVFALPGNPASALVTFYVFVLPALRKLSGCAAGADGWSLPRTTVTLATPMRLDPRPEFHRVVLKTQHGRLVAHSTGSQRSS